MIQDKPDISQPGRKFRFERKFLLRDMKPFYLGKMILLSKAGFSEKYYSRKINNIYFDTPGFDFYSASVRGYSQREKVRIRWYGDIYGSVDNAVLEIKHKTGNINYKSSYNLGSLNFSDRSGIPAQVNRALHNSGIPVYILSWIKSLKPVLFNHYERKYYVSVTNDIRLTLDQNLRFLNIDRLKKRYLNKTSEDNLSVLELKYDLGMDDFINEITGHFPFRLTKCSKYVLGVNRVLLFSDLS